MSKPRVFISSTFYDLRQVREDLERFIKELGYEPVRNEQGDIPYGKEESVEASAYREIELCDIVVNIIGGRFGTESNIEKGYSITQKELKQAVDRGIQVFIFIEESTHSEFSTYLLNKDNSSTKYRFVDDVRVYQFIEIIQGLPRNNPIATFQTAKDITDYLRNQWAGLFQRFLEEQKRLQEVKVLEELKSVASTLQQITKYLTAERKNKDEALNSILLANHPAFRRFAKVTQTNYRVFFTNKNELTAWLGNRGFLPNDGTEYPPEADSVAEWINKKALKFIKLIEEIFDAAGNLKIYTDSTWNDQWLEEGGITPPVDPAAPESDDVPF